MATMNIGSLVVDLIAESAQYIQGLQESNRETQRWSQQVSNSFSRTTRSIAGMAAGFLSVSAAMSAANAAMANAKEIENLSRLTNQSVEEFQAATYAVDQYGVSAQKLGDISKDVADKLGDFIATGGGEFADFFENVAPQVGLTAKELQGLSGPDVLIAVKKAMDDANLSMEEQIFYLENIANDSSLLMPLLEDNGKAYRDLAQEARDANVVMSQADISALRESEIIISRVSKQMSTSFARAVAGSAEQIEWLGDVTSRTMIAIGDIMDSFNDDTNTLGGTFIKLGDLIDEQKELEEKLSSMTKEYGAANIWDALFFGPTSKGEVRTQLKEIEEEIDRLQEKRNEMQMPNMPSQPALPDFNGVIEPVISSVIITPETDQAAADKAANDFIKANQNMLDNLIRQLATQEELINKTYVDQVNAINDLVLNETQIRAEGYQTLEQLQIDYITKADANRQESLDRLKQDTADTTNEMASQMDTLAEAIGVDTETMKTAVTSWANSFSSELANMVTQGEIDFSRLAESIINDLIRMAIQANITQPLLAAMGLGGSSGGGVGGDGVGPPAPSGLASGGSVMRGSTYLVGEQGPELFTASNSGSIIPNNKMGGGNTTVNVYTQPGETAETKTRSTAQGDVVEIFMKQVDSRMNEQISRGQGLARTLEGRYSLNRKSY